MKSAQNFKTINLANDKLTPYSYSVCEADMQFNIDKKQFVKRTADWLEKISVASIIVGLFQKDDKMAAGFVVGILAFIGSHILDNIWRKL